MQFFIKRSPRCCRRISKKKGVIAFKGLNTYEKVNKLRLESNQWSKLLHGPYPHRKLTFLFSSVPYSLQLQLNLSSQEKSTIFVKIIFNWVQIYSSWENWKSLNFEAFNGSSCFGYFRCIAFQCKLFFPCWNVKSPLDTRLLPRNFMNACARTYGATAAMRYWMLKICTESSTRWLLYQILLTGIGHVLLY